MTRKLASRSSWLRIGAVALSCLVLGVVLPKTADAQFGKNRVQYREFSDWKIYRSPHFNVHYYEEEAHLLQKAVSFAESAYDELSRTFDFQIQDPTPLIIYATHSAFLQNNIILNGVPEGAVAFATPSRFRMVMPMDLPDPDLMALMKHELTHIFQYHILFRGRLGAGLRAGPPQWFMEGMASYFGDDESPTEKKFIRDMVVNDQIPSVQGGIGGYLAYRYGHAIFDFIEERWGKETVVDFLYEMRNTLGGDVGRAIERVFRMDAEDFDLELRRYLRKRYLTELVQTGEPGDFGRPFRLNPGQRGQEFSPVASPGGDLVASITTDKGETDISLFDAQRRQRLRVLTKGFQNEIQGIQVSTSKEPGADLAFSPDGNFIAAFGRREGFNSLILVDVINGGITRVIDMEVEQARTPAWSPTENAVYFSGNLNGQWDLFRVDLDSLEIVNVTNDASFDTAPSFSADGQWLAYTTFVGAYQQIYRMDPRDPSKRFALTAGEHNNKEAVFSPDGDRVYFTSDRDGVDNIYGLDLQNGLISQYTDVVTACDRPTVLPLPEGGERLVYNGYWKRSFDLYMRDVDEPVSPPRVADFVGDEPVSVTAELPRFEPDIEVSLDDANVDDYRGFKFFLENADSFLGVSSNNIFVGRVQLSWSDYLGDRRIFTTLGAIDTFSDFNATYLDVSRRWQWSATVSDSRFYGVLRDQRTGLAFEQSEIFRVTGAQARINYPLSLKQRFEFGLGFQVRSYNFNATVDDTAGNRVPVIVPRDDEYPIVSADFVSDTTLFNQWGPISGHRVRVGASYAPDLDESGALETRFHLDARKYIPVTRRSNFAFRLFVSEADGNFPNPTFIGGLDTIRGFDFREFAGHRSFFANVEYRFPLIDQLAFPILRFEGIRGVIFFDIGGAYFPNEIEAGVPLGLPTLEPPEFNCFDDADSGRLDGCIASFGYGISLRFLGFSLNFDFAKRWDLDSTLSDFESAFWIGTRF